MVPISDVLLVASLLFMIGLSGVVVRRNVVVLIVCLELMFAGGSLALVGFSRGWKNHEGQLVGLFVLALITAEVVVALALIHRLFRGRESLDVQTLDALGDRRGPG